ncbi:hypothetical protein [Streptomyces sp. NPDC059957]|uniref:hypothetical protein n=1 Tax=unclassified Streptomyces TaxID=2593676 RepID=UPI003664A1A4
MHRAGLRLSSSSTDAVEQGLGLGGAPAQLLDGPGITPCPSDQAKHGPPSPACSSTP